MTTKRPLVVTTRYGRVILPPDVVERLAPQTKARRFDRRYRTAARDERYQRFLEGVVERRYMAQVDALRAIPISERPAFLPVQVRAGG